MKYLKQYEKFEFNEEDFDFEEDDPNVEIHNGIIITEDDLIHYKFKLIDDDIEPGDLVVRIEEENWKGEFGAVISRTYGDYGDTVSLCLDGWDDVESDWTIPKIDLSKIKIVK